MGQPDQVFAETIRHIEEIFFEHLSALQKIMKNPSIHCAAMDTVVPSTPVRSAACSKFPSSSSTSPQGIEDAALISHDQAHRSDTEHFSDRAESAGLIRFFRIWRS